MRTESNELKWRRLLSFPWGWLGHFKNSGISDEDLVGDARRSLAYSKWVRGAFAVSGLIHGLAASVVFYFMLSPTHGVRQALGTTQTEGGVAMLELGWGVGLFLGFLTGLLGFVGLLFLMIALVWPRLQKRDRLLLAYHDQVNGIQVEASGEEGKSESG